MDVSVGGAAQIRAEVQDTSREDLARAEVNALPLTLLILVLVLVLVLVFRSAVAALLPVIIGLIAIVGTNASLRVITGFTDVSVFALNLTTALGLGLAVDHGLFIVRRYREELHGGAPPAAAVRTTLATAGRTVAFSALTVAVAFSAMLLFPMYYLRSFAYAGISVVLVAAAAAFLVLPALLLVLGRRIDALDLTRLFRRASRGPAPDASGRRWRRIGEAVVKCPVVFAVTAVAFLVALGAPFLGVTFGNIDDRQLPKDAEAHQVHQVIREGFTSRPNGELDVVAQGVDGARRGADVAADATTLSRLDGVVRVNSSAGTYAEGRLVQPAGPAHTRYTTTGATYLAVEPSLEDVSPESQDLVRDIRAAKSPFPVLMFCVAFGLSMSTYEALPPSYARVHERFRTPGRATVVAGVATGVFYTVMTLVSEHVLVDTIYALGLMICFYYALTAFACAWFFRGVLARSVRDAPFRRTVQGSVPGGGRPAAGRRADAGDAAAQSGFFRGEVLTTGTPALVVQD
ncbi:MMPL family transporter [Streptomyces sp. S.PB5]|uniref:MMPL family transporter n=1 Tax=Streptomyces sp. S.PB5 TaxID=3020844 RepID=UPI0025B18652|nr:MMPL family transporter [Streptomyces sp. S.PB5]MDN3023269.1 MMPL family transporter [Streptomyces sp. S.PB5]